MNRKRLVAVLLAMTFMMAAGCGSSESTTDVSSAQTTEQTNTDAAASSNSADTAATEEGTTEASAEESNQETTYEVSGVKFTLPETWVAGETGQGDDSAIFYQKGGEEALPVLEIFDCGDIGEDDFEKIQEKCITDLESQYEEISSISSLTDYASETLDIHTYRWEDDARSGCLGIVQNNSNGSYLYFYEVGDAGSAAATVKDFNTVVKSIFTNAGEQSTAASFTYGADEESAENNEEAAATSESERAEEKDSATTEKAESEASEEETETTEQTTVDSKGDDEESKVEQKLRSYISDNYTYTRLDDLSVNEDYGTDAEGDYIALIYLTWSQKNSGSLSQQVLTMYSEDMAARIYDDLPEIQEMAIFWTVPYLNNGSAKLSFARRDSGMAYTDKVFDSNFD